MGTVTSTAHPRRGRHRPPAPPNVRVPFGPFPLCYATHAFTPQLALGAAAWASLVKDANARGICEHRVTRFFYALCAPTDASLGTVSAKALVKHIHGNARVHRLVETWVRRCAGQHTHMLFEECVRALLTALHGSLPARIQLVLDLRVKDPFLGRATVQDLIVFLTRQLTSRVRLDNWADSTLSSTLPPMARILLAHLHSDGSLHDRDAFTHYCLRYSMLIPPIQLTLRHMRMTTLGPDGVCSEEHSDAFRAAATQHAAKASADMASLMGPEFDARVALACTARVLLLEAASTLAQPFCFGTHVTSIDVPDETTLVKPRQSQSSSRRSMSERSGVMSAKLHSLRGLSMTGITPMGEQQPSSRAMLSGHNASVAPMRLTVELDPEPDTSADAAAIVHVAAVVPAEQPEQPHSLEAMQLELQTQQRHVALDVAGRVVGGLFSPRASTRADITSDVTRNRVGMLAFGGASFEKRLQARAATEAELPLFATVNAPIRSPPPTCSEFVRSHPPPHGADADLTSGVIAQRVLAHALTGTKAGSVYGVVHAACLLCGRDAAGIMQAPPAHVRSGEVSGMHSSPGNEDAASLEPEATSALHDGGALLSSAPELPGSTEADPSSPVAMRRRSLLVRREGASVMQIAKLERAKELRDKDAQLVASVAHAQALMAAVGGHVPSSGADNSSESTTAATIPADMEDATVRVLMQRDRANVERSVLQELERETERQLNVAAAVAHDLVKPVTIFSMRRVSIDMPPPGTEYGVRRNSTISPRRGSVTVPPQRRLLGSMPAERSGYAAINQESALATVARHSFRRRSSSSPRSQHELHDGISDAAMPRDIEGNSGFCRDCLRYTWRALVDVVGFKSAAVVVRSAVFTAPSDVAVDAEMATARSSHDPLFTARVSDDSRTILRVADDPVDDTYLQFFDNGRRAPFWYNVCTGISTWTKPPDAATIIRRDVDG